MFADKIRTKKSGILLYGITPPKARNSPDKNQEISQKCIQHVLPLSLDGLVIYDLQDESSRTAQERPFPFLPTLDSYAYATDYLQALPIPKIIYRSVGKLPQPELAEWIANIQETNFSTVFVGAPSIGQVVHTRLPEAYAVWQQYNQSALLGGVMIPERHDGGRNEHLKIIHKMQAGCSFFVSQCVYCIARTKDVLSDLYFYCQAHRLPVPTMIFTLTTCGSIKTMDFMDWLGIHLPVWLRNELAHCADILSKSVELSLAIAEEIIEFCQAKGIPFGFNIESVSIRKDEIDASLYLLNRVAQMLHASGVRRAADQVQEVAVS